MGSKVWIWKNIPGVPGRCNDVLYAHSKSQSTRNFLVFFGGDVQVIRYPKGLSHDAVKLFHKKILQDIQENMEKHSDSKKYVKWSLDNTATMLSEQFTMSHILIVRPARMSITRNAIFSCFDNFVPGDKYGTPSFCPMHNALKHLREFFFHCLEHIKTLKIGEDMDIHNIEATNLSLMGFSKGCAVLNQFLHEFHYYREHPDEDVDINNFIKSIKDMWWLDGGHNGSRDTWITERNILQSFAKLRINAHIHVTPYQVCDTHRPWIREEETYFNENLQNMNVPVQRILHFGDRSRSLSLHFNVLTAIGKCK